MKKLLLNISSVILCTFKNTINARRKYQNKKSSIFFKMDIIFEQHINEYPNGQPKLFFNWPENPTEVKNIKN